MSSREKLISSIRNNPRNVRFDEAKKVAEWLGFTASGGKGSHVSYTKVGEREGLNFQNVDGSIKPYQARQLIAMIDKYHLGPTSDD